jgi:hypothetical protein
MNATNAGGRMNATIITLAKRSAIKAIERGVQAQGGKPAAMPRRIILAAASAYLREHPELIEEAAETVRKVPQLRTLAEREERQLQDPGYVRTVPRTTDVNSQSRL